MASTEKTTLTFEASPETLLDVLTDPDFEIAQQVAQEGTKSATVKTVSKTEDRLVYEIHCVEYEKGMTGINKNKTENTVTTVTWDLKKMSSDWTYEGSNKRVKVWGATQVKKDPKGGAVQNEFRVDVKIPLVGGKIEKIVLKEVNRFWPTYEKLVKEFCAKS